MAVEWLKRGGLARMQLFVDDPTLYEVKWFRVPDGAKFIFEPIAFRHRFYGTFELAADEQCNRQQCGPHTGVGMQWPYDPNPCVCPNGYPYANRAPPAAYSGQEKCGSDRVWREGARKGKDPEYQCDNQGVPPCCKGEGVSASGGQWQGGAAFMASFAGVGGVGGQWQGGAAEMTPGDTWRAFGGQWQGGEADFMGPIIQDDIKFYGGVWFHYVTLDLRGSAEWDNVTIAGAGRKRVMVRVLIDGDTRLKGLVPVENGGSGQARVLLNTSNNYKLTIAHNDSDHEANRFLCPSGTDLPIGPFGGAWCWWNPVPLDTAPPGLGWFVIGWREPPPVPPPTPPYPTLLERHFALGSVFGLTTEWQDTGVGVLLPESGKWLITCNPEGEVQDVMNGTSITAKLVNNTTHADLPESQRIVTTSQLGGVINSATACLHYLYEGNEGDQISLYARIAAGTTPAGQISAAYISAVKIAPPVIP